MKSTSEWGREPAEGMDTDRDAKLQPFCHYLAGSLLGGLVGG